jgi:hypothetical protein
MTMTWWDRVWRFQRIIGVLNRQGAERERRSEGGTCWDQVGQRSGCLVSALRFVTT